MVSTEVCARSFGELLDTGFYVLLERFSLLTALGGIVYGPAAVIDAVVFDSAWWTANVVGRDSSTIAAAFAVHTLSSACLVLIAWPLATAAMIHAVEAHCEARVVSLRESLTAAARLYLPLAGTSFLCWLLVLVGLIVVLPGILLALGFLLIGQVVVIEERFGAAAMRRSWFLMRGHRLRGAALALVTGLIATVPPVIVQLMLEGMPVLGLPLSTLAYSVGLAYSVIVMVLFHIDLRCRKESFEVRLLARAIAGDGCSEST